MISIKKLAEATRVTTRTLRYYDSRGLLEPTGKTEGGHRLYSDQDLMKLQQIQFLKQMGFRLRDIQEVLEKKDIKPREYLNKQLQLLRRKQDELKGMETNILGLIHSYEIEGKLNWPVIIDLIQQSQINESKRNLKEELFDLREQQLLANLPNMNQDDENIKEWVELIGSLQQVVHKDPASPEVQKLVRTMTEKSDAMCEDDQELLEKIWEVRKSSEKSREMGWYPLDQKLINFLDQAFKVYDGSEKKGDS